MLKVILGVSILCMSMAAVAADGSSPSCNIQNNNLDMLAAVRDEIKKQYLARDPIESLRGEWHFEYLGKNRSIKFDENHAFFDSEFGKGDIQHINGDRYRLTYYASHSIYGQIECELVLQKTGPNEISTIVMEKEGLHPCRLGKMKRAP